MLIEMLAIVLRLVIICVEQSLQHLHRLATRRGVGEVAVFSNQVLVTVC